MYMHTVKKECIFDIRKMYHGSCLQDLNVKMKNYYYSYHRDQKIEIKESFGENKRYIFIIMFIIIHIIYAMFRVQVM